MNNLIIRLLSIILGALFLISGGVKSIDPFGGALKIEEYIIDFNLTWLNDYDTILSILLSTSEMVFGFFLLFNTWRKFVALVVVLFMILFTIITAYLAFDPYLMINECGCFGEAIKLTNHQTFFKNIIILGISIIYIVLVFRAKIHCNNKILLSLSLIIFSLSIPLYSILYLPPYDFLSYNVGTNLESNSSFKVFNLDYKNVADSILKESYDKPILAITHLEILDNKEISKINNLIHEYSNEFSIIILSCSNNNYKNVHTYYADSVLLKELMRAKTGVIAIKRGIITNKWNLLTLNAEKIKQVK